MLLHIENFKNEISWKFRISGYLIYDKINKKFEINEIGAIIMPKYAIGKLKLLSVTLLHI